jgi:hypothetical protein
MNIKELIESLSKIEDQNIRVMVRGYEEGYDDIIIGNGIDNNTTVIPAIVNVALNVNEEWYYGRHERVENIDQNTIGMYNVVKAIIL